MSGIRRTPGGTLRLPRTKLPGSCRATGVGPRGARGQSAFPAPIPPFAPEADCSLTTSPTSTMGPIYWVFRTANSASVVFSAQAVRPSSSSRGCRAGGNTQKRARRSARSLGNLHTARPKGSSDAGITLRPVRNRRRSAPELAQPANCTLQYWAASAHFRSYLGFSEIYCPRDVAPYRTGRKNSHAADLSYRIKLCGLPNSPSWKWRFVATQRNRHAGRT